MSFGLRPGAPPPPIFSSFSVRARRFSGETGWAGRGKRSKGQSRGKGQKNNSPAEWDSSLRKSLIRFHINPSVKKWRDRTLLGPGGRRRNAPEASAGRPCDSGDRSFACSGDGGGIVPAPSTKKSAPHDSKRAALAPGPWKHLALTPFLFSRN